MALHECPTCGMTHDQEGRAPVLPEVEIARINADRDVRVAELQRGEFQKTELEAETEVAVAEIEAAAQVEEASVKAGVLDDLITPPEADPEPVVIVDDTTTEPEPVADDAPPVIEPAAPPAAKRSNPWW